MRGGRIKQRKKKLYERIAELCEVPEEVVADIPVIIMRGRHEIEISGCTGVKEYGDGRIVVALRLDKVESFAVVGESLVMTDFCDDVLYIRGDIISAGFCGEESGSCSGE